MEASNSLRRGVAPAGLKPLAQLLGSNAEACVGVLEDASSCRKAESALVADKGVATIDLHIGEGQLVDVIKRESLGTPEQLSVGV